MVDAAGAEAVPARLPWDNETGIRFGILTEPAAAFVGTPGIQIELVKARDPESKGIVERMNRFFRSRFMSGRAFTSPEDFKQQVAGWLPIANNRLARSRRGRPGDLVRIDRLAVRGLPPMAPEVMIRNSGS